MTIKFAGVNFKTAVSKKGEVTVSFNDGLLAGVSDALHSARSTFLSPTLDTALAAFDCEADKAFLDVDLPFPAFVELVSWLAFARGHKNAQAFLVAAFAESLTLRLAGQATAEPVAISHFAKASGADSFHPVLSELRDGTIQSPTGRRGLEKLRIAAGLPNKAEACFNAHEQELWKAAVILYDKLRSAGKTHKQAVARIRTVTKHQ
jgi:hypothetical protein